MGFNVESGPKRKPCVSEVSDQPSSKMVKTKENDVADLAQGIISSHDNSQELASSRLEECRVTTDPRIQSDPLSLIIKNNEDIISFCEKFKGYMGPQVRVKCLDLSNSSVRQIQEISKTSENIKLEKPQYTNGYGFYIPTGVPVIGPEAYHCLGQDLGEIPLLPENIDLEAILEEPDPLNNGVKRKDTQVLAFLPCSINGAPLTINHFREKICELEEIKTFEKLDLSSDFINDAPVKSSWVLFTKQPLLESLENPVKEHEKLDGLRKFFIKDPDYRLPSMREVIITSMMCEIQLGLSPWSNCDYVRCQESESYEYSKIINAANDEQEFSAEFSWLVSANSGDEGLDIYREEPDDRFYEVFKMGVVGLRVLNS